MGKCHFYLYEPLRPFIACFAERANKFSLPTLYVYCVYPTMSQCQNTTAKFDRKEQKQVPFKWCSLSPYWGPSWSYGGCIYNYLYNQYLSPLTLWVSPNPAYGELYSIQHYVINVAVTYDSSVVFTGYVGFLHQ